mgnify:CR=1 FL=1
MSGIIDVAEKQNRSSISKPRNGLGTFVYPDGRIYVGEFKEGSFHLSLIHISEPTRPY